jgi:microcompartment protein CcmK/EutM
VILCRVLGSAVATRKDEKLAGTKLLVVAEADPDGVGGEELHVAADAIGAGTGDLVLVTIGSAARLTAATRGLPLDALVVAIVDTVERDGGQVYDAREATG